MNTGSSSERTVAHGHRRVSDRRGRLSAGRASDRRGRQSTGSTPILGVEVSCQGGSLVLRLCQGMKCYYVSFREPLFFSENLLWARKDGAGTSWLYWAWAFCKEAGRQKHRFVLEVAVRIWWWIGCEMRSSESGWLIGYWTVQLSKLWCFWRWPCLHLDAVFKTTARLFLSPLAWYYSDVTFKPQPSLSSHFPLSIAFVATENVTYFTSLSYFGLYSSQNMGFHVFLLLFALL